MELDTQSDMPIFLQIAQQLENAILSGGLEEDMQAPSTTEISLSFKINPATALKGVNKLADDGILYKKRGLGMFVAHGAREMILKKRKQQFYEKYVIPLLSEAEKLAISKEELNEMLKRGVDQ